MDVGSIRHPKRRALWRNAAFIALLTLLIATVAGSHARADGPVASCVSMAADLNMIWPVSASMLMLVGELLIERLSR